jgi:hypothetical protein
LDGIDPRRRRFIDPFRSRAPSLYCFCQQAWQISVRRKAALSSNNSV